MIPEVKNIIFDLGGVILDIDYARLVESFRKLGAEQFEALFSQGAQANFMSQFERGEIKPAEFRKKVKSFLPDEVTDEEIDEAWNSILGPLPSQRIVLLKMLDRMGYRLFLLSNTNSIHIKAFTHYLDETYGKHLFKDLFEKVYYSSKIGMRKPTKKVFDYVLKENGLVPEETLFIDDSAQHVEAANKLGVHTHHLKEPETIHDFFSGLTEVFPDKAQ